jgi:hypothetical protein
LSLSYATKPELVSYNGKKWSTNFEEIRKRWSLNLTFVRSLGTKEHEYSIACVFG